MVSGMRRRTCSVELLLFLYIFGQIFALLHRQCFMLHGLVLSLKSSARPEETSLICFFEPGNVFKLSTPRIQYGGKYRFMHALGVTAVKQFLLSNLLFLCGVNLLNPGPSYRFPCGECRKPCNSNQKAIFCDGCSIWFHATCQSLFDEQYFQPGLPTDKWLCFGCRQPVFFSVYLDVWVWLSPVGYFFINKLFNYRKYFRFLRSLPPA